MYIAQYDTVSAVLWPLWASLDFVVQPLECVPQKTVIQVQGQEPSFSQKITPKHASSLSCVHEDEGGSEHVEHV